jgi:hypothetical protein
VEQLLIQRAHAEVELATDGDPTPEPAGHAAAAILLAAAAFDAHLGEWMARPANHQRFTGEELDALRWKPGYKVARAILRKRDVAKDPRAEKWYRRLKGLYELKAQATHASSDKRDTGTFPPRLAPYIADGTFAPAGEVAVDWTSRLLVKAVAEHAITIAERAAAAFDEGVRDWTV